MKKTIVLFDIENEPNLGRNWQPIYLVLKKKKTCKCIEIFALVINISVGENLLKRIYFSTWPTFAYFLLSLDFFQNKNKCKFIWTAFYVTIKQRIFIAFSWTRHVFTCWIPNVVYPYVYVLIHVSSFIRRFFRLWERMKNKKSEDTLVLNSGVTRVFVRWVLIIKCINTSYNFNISLIKICINYICYE